MTTIPQRFLAASTLLIASTAGLAAEPDQLALELALSLSNQTVAVQKSAVDQHASARTAVAAQAALLTGSTQPLGEK